MAKYYVQCGSLYLIYSTNKTPREACRRVIWECNEHDILDEFFYVDERGFRGYATAQPDTIVIPTQEIIEAENFPLNEGYGASHSPDGGRQNFLKFFLDSDDIYSILRRQRNGGPH